MSDSESDEESAGDLRVGVLAGAVDDAVKDPAGVKKRAILLSTLSESTYKLAADLVLPKEVQEVPYEDIVSALDNHFTPKSVGFGERHHFYATTQLPQESPSQWAARLRGLTAQCDFSNVEEALRDRFIMGMLPGVEKEKMYVQELAGLTFARAVELTESLRSARSSAAASAATEAVVTELYKIGKRSPTSVPQSAKVKCSEQYPAVFSDKLGQFNKYKVNLRLKESAHPIFFKPRPVAFALREKVEKEINRLVGLGVLRPVEHSDYASPIVPVLKRDGSVRICADYSVTINKQLVVEQYPLPTVNELFSKLYGGQKFSKLDLSMAYGQFCLDEESQKLTCINTHKGIFAYTRLVFGLASGPSIFQRAMDTVLAGLDGTLCLLDDVLITGRNDSEHLERLHQVLQRLQDAGFVLQKSKCQFEPQTRSHSHAMQRRGPTEDYNELCTIQ
ncbi:uncharacterized protein K02A2.6-like [Bombyx mori]|uniref:uncharacterized protein K02A2.6-like n=1 Tax=Bombyx mori TaxID=7091 RepID=UPI002ED06FBB